MLTLLILILGITIYPLYFTNYGMAVVDRSSIDYVFLFLGILIFAINIIRNKPSFYILFPIVAIIYIEYIFNPFLIHNFAPESTVALISDISGNYGLVFFSLSALMGLIGMQFSNISKKLIYWVKIFLIILYFSYLFCIFSVMDIISTLELLDRSYGVNIHTYYLMGLALFVFTFSIFDESTSSPILTVFFLVNLLLNIFIFKTRGTLYLNILLFFFSSSKNIRISRYFFKNVFIAKVFLIFSIFIVYIYLFLLHGQVDTNQHNEERVEDFGGILGKELSGKRDIILQQWISYTKRYIFWS